MIFAGKLLKRNCTKEWFSKIVFETLKFKREKRFFEGTLFERTTLSQSSPYLAYIFCKNFYQMCISYFCTSLNTIKKKIDQKKTFNKNIPQILGFLNKLSTCSKWFLTKTQNLKWYNISLLKYFNWKFPFQFQFVKPQTKKTI